MLLLNKKNVFWPTFTCLAAMALFCVLWCVRSEPVTYKDMACAFEERESTCFDSLEKWNEGLTFFDSSLNVDGDTLKALKDLLWNFWKIEFSGSKDAATKESTLPLQVLKSERAGCVGLAWLAMMVAEEKNVNLHARLLPGHVFLHYGNVNLEPNRKGYSYTDEEYREKYKGGPWTGLEFKNLDVRELAGLASFNIANLYLEREPHRALRWYRLAEELFPQYPGITVNQNIAKNKLGQK